MKEKVCEECGHQFELKKVIDGKIRNLQRRRFCLECSPFGAHNTSHDPLVSNLSKQERAKRARVKKVVQWRQRTKEKLIQYKGGKCENCGYDKNCPDAFVFHCPDSDGEEFAMSKAYSKSFAKIKEEIDNCQLLCVLCHAEIHDVVYQES